MSDLYAVENVHLRKILRRMQGEIDAIRAKIEAKPANGGWRKATKAELGGWWARGWEHVSGAWVRSERKGEYMWGNNRRDQSGRATSTLGEAKNRALGK